MDSMNKDISKNDRWMKNIGTSQYSNKVLHCCNASVENYSLEMCIKLYCGSVLVPFPKVTRVPLMGWQF